MQKTLPNGWEWKKLGEVTYCLDSKRVPMNSKQREGMKGDIPYYGANGEVDRINQYLFDEELLLVAEDGGSWGFKENCAYIIKGKSWVNNHAHVLRVKSEVLIKFIESYLNLTNLTAYIGGTTRGKLNQKDLNNIQIPTPPLQIQKKIVEILGYAERLKQRRKRANEETGKVLQAIFMKMFGNPANSKYPIKKLEEVCKKITDGSHRTPKILEEGFPFLTVANMGDRDFDYAECKKISQEDYNDLVKNDCKPFIGDVLFSKDGTVGKVMEIKETKEQVILSSISILRPIPNMVNSTYLATYMKTAFALNEALNMKSGSAIRRIILRDIKRIKIPLPPLHLQNKFSELVERVEKTKEHQESSTSEINALFDALMQKAFNGELIK